MIDAGVQETLFLPLLGRARAARTWPTCFRDPWSERAVSLAAAVRPDIQDRDMGEMPASIYALRHLAAVTEIRRYLQDRPAAAWAAGSTASSTTSTTAARPSTISTSPRSFGFAPPGWSPTSASATCRPP